MEKELFQLAEQLLQQNTEGHEEITVNGKTLTVDYEKKDENTMIVTVSLHENKDKKEFETWVNNLDDEFFNEVWENLSDIYGLKELNDTYDNGNYQEVISKFKSTAKELAQQKINLLSKILED